MIKYNNYRITQIKNNNSKIKKYRKIPSFIIHSPSIIDTDKCIKFFYNWYIYF